MTTHEDVKRLAFELYEKDGRPEGRDLEHWFEAERLVNAGRSPSSSPSGRKQKLSSAPDKATQHRQRSARRSVPADEQTGAR